MVDLVFFVRADGVVAMAFLLGRGEGVMSKSKSVSGSTAATTFSLPFAVELTP